MNEEKPGAGGVNENLKKMVKIVQGIQSNI